MRQFFGFRTPRIWRELRRRLASAHQSDVPFLAEIVVESPPRIVNLEPFHGLVLAHTTVGEDHTKMLTYWKSREHFERDGRAFAKTVAATSIGWRGYVRDYLQPRERWFKRVPWYTFLATFFAILGAYENGRLQMNRFEARPEVQLSVERQGDFNYFVNDPIDERVFISNHIPVEQSIRVAGADLYAGNRPLHLLNVEGTGIRELKESETTHVRLLGRVAVPGTYVLKLSIAARAGRFRDEQTFAVNRQLTVWQRLPRLEDRRIISVQEDTCFVVATILIGESAAKGLNVSLRLPRHPEVTEVLTSYAGASAAEGWERSGPPGQEIGRRAFTTSASIPGFRQLHMQFVMIGTSSTQWPQVIHDLSIHVAANN
ncbi:MAG: hypothetical protein JWO56_3800 [Acidobacteria bacterium]|nr:hypothetical protein [Acidobacteriota bacterium]